MSSGRAANRGDGGRTGVEQGGAVAGKVSGMSTLNTTGEVVQLAISAGSSEYSIRLNLLQGGSPGGGV